MNRCVVCPRIPSAKAAPYLCAILVCPLYPFPLPLPPPLDMPCGAWYSFFNVVHKVFHVLWRNRREICVVTT